MFKQVVSLSFALLLCVGCSEDGRNAGGVTDIGNSIAGRIFLSDGTTPAAYARVVAYEDSWKNSQIADSVEAIADSLGFFELDEKALSMQILSATLGSEKILFDHVDDSMEVVLGNSRTISGRIAEESSGKLRVVGTNLSADVGADGSFTLYEVPSGNLSLSFTDEAKPVSLFKFKTADNRDSLVLPDLKRLSEEDTLLVVDASLNEDSLLDFGIELEAIAGVKVELSWISDETLEGFVLPVKLNDRIDFETFASPDSFKIVSEFGKELPFEVDYWTPSRSQGVLWVRLDSIPKNASEVNLYLVRSESRSVKNRAYLESDSIVAALHLNGDANIVAASDRDSAKGYIGYGTTLSKGQYISLDSLDPFAGEFTLSTWAYWNGPDGNHQVLFAKRDSKDRMIFQWYYDRINSTFAVYDIVKWDSIPCSLGTVDSLNWNLLSLVSKNDSVSMFVNGVQVGKTIPFALRSDSEIPFRVGGNEIQEETWNGSLDEIRVVKRARSESWLRMEYETQKAAKN